MQEPKGIAPSKASGKPQRNNNKKRKHDTDTKSGSSTSSKRKRAEPGEEDGDLPGNANGGSHSTNEHLLEEIRALGGDEEDLALVGDIDSDSEHEGGADTHEPVDAALQAELQALATQLGFQPLRTKSVAEKPSSAKATGIAKADAKPAAADKPVPKEKGPALSITDSQSVAQKPTDAPAPAPSSSLRQSGVTKQFVS
jgi:ribosome biogenesis protein MAK21